MLSRPFSVILVVLAALHFYVGARILPALPVVPPVKWLGALWLVVSFVSIPLAMLSSRRRHRHGPLSDQLVWVGMLALGMFSSLVLLTLARDIVLLLDALAHPPSARLVSWSALAVLVLAALSSLLGLINARRLARVVDVEIPLANLPAALDGFTIVQISDIHVGPTIKHGYLSAIVDKVNALDADLIAITGDLVDGHVSRLSAHTAPLAKLAARHGAYFVTGNHEYYSNAPDWIVELRRLGLRVLLNEHVMVEHRGASLMVAGVTDFSAHHYDAAQRSDPVAASAGAPAHVDVRLLLAHQPRSAAAAAEAGFDLQLSGHTHGGQFFPWTFFVRLQQPYTAGLSRLHQLWVYTSRGTGYWGPPKRLWAPSEITRLRLIPA